MTKIKIIVVAITIAASGCATGMGCAAGAVTGAGLATVASLKQGVGVETIGYLSGGALFGAITGCVAGFFAGKRATSIERERTAQASPAAAPNRSDDEARSAEEAP